jgi:phosphoribosylformylglycinamidine synthase I
MSAAVKACVVAGFGINADEELALAFELAGADTRRVHVADLIAEPGRLGAFRILAFPGGFSFGDHLGSGKVFALLFKRNLGEALLEFVGKGGLVIGICNGFQILVKMGLLPNLGGDFSRQEVSLIHNDSGKFEDRWVRLSFAVESPCLWTKGLDFMDVPVRHGEGKLVTGSPQTLGGIETGGLAAARYVSPNGGPVRYPDNPNGSVRDIAGLCDTTGRIFGLMPHPEAFLFKENHPDWSLGGAGKGGELHGAGLRIFRAGVAAAGA